MGKNSDSVGETVAKSTLGSLATGFFGTVGKALSGMVTGESTKSTKGQANGLESDFQLEPNGIQNRILREQAAEMILDKKSGKCTLRFHKNAEFTGEQIEYILTGKDYKKNEKDV